MTTRTNRSTQAGGPTRREQLTAIAATLFARDGYHNVTVGDIAAAAGLSGPAIYRHFPGKQAILAEVVRSGFDEMARAVTADLDEVPEPASRLRTVYGDLAAFVIRRPEFGVMWRREYRHLAPSDAAELAKRMSQASDTAVIEIRRLRPELSADDAELLSWAALSVLGSISDHRVRLPRAAFEELLAGIAMDVVSTELGAAVEDNRPHESRPGDRREKILAAAAQLFWDRGYHAVTMEEIGAAAGIAGPSIYSHFAGKTDLLRTITERIGERLRLTLDEPERAAAAAADNLAAGSDRQPAKHTRLDLKTAANAAPTTAAAATTAANAATTAAAAATAANVATTATAAANAANAATSATNAAAVATAAAPTAATAPATLSRIAAEALSALTARYITTVLTSRDLVAAYFTEGHNLPDRDRADTRRFQRAYTSHWAALLSCARPDLSPEEVRIRVLAAFAVVNDTARTRRLMDRPGLEARLRAVMLAVLLTPASRARDVNRR